MGNKYHNVVAIVQTQELGAPATIGCDCITRNSVRVNRRQVWADTCVTSKCSKFSEHRSEDETHQPTVKMAQYHSIQTIVDIYIAEYYFIRHLKRRRCLSVVQKVTKKLRLYTNRQTSSIDNQRALTSMYLLVYKTQRGNSVVGEIKVCLSAGNMPSLVVSYTTPTFVY